MPPVPGDHNGLGTAAAVVGTVSLLLGIVLPIFLVGGLVGVWLSWRARQRVIDGDASNPRVVIAGFLTSSAAAALFLVLLTIGVLRSSGAIGA